MLSLPKSALRALQTDLGGTRNPGSAPKSPEEPRYDERSESTGSNRFQDLSGFYKYLMRTRQGLRSYL